MNISKIHKEKTIIAHALVYSEDGSILLQKNSDIGTWHFLNRLVGKGESSSEILREKLLEKFGYIENSIGTKIFHWQINVGSIEIDNHFFPIRLGINSRFLIHDDSTTRWFSMEDIISLPLAPVLYENFSKVIRFLNKIHSILVINIEDKLLACNNLIKKNDRVFYAKKIPFYISRQQIFLLKELALLKNISVFRVCIHTNDKDTIHEMLMMHVSRISMGPLKQNKTSLSYHVIEGSLRVKLYSEIGDQIEEYLIGRDDSLFENISLRLNANEYRSVHTNSEYAIFLEVASGPFIDSDTVWFKGKY